MIPADFIGFAKPLHQGNDHQDKLMSNFFAQTQALMQGKNAETVREELTQQGKSPEEIETLLLLKFLKGTALPTPFLLNSSPLPTWVHSSHYTSTESSFRESFGISTATTNGVWGGQTVGQQHPQRFR